MKKLVRLVSYVAMLCTAACIATNDAGETKFITLSAAMQLNELKFMTPKVHESQWTVGYRYGGECTVEDRKNDSDLKEAISDSLRTWLKPLKELRPKHPIVDKFVYELHADFNPANPKDLYNPNQAEDIAEGRRVDLRVTFQCKQGVSFALTGLLSQPEVVMRSGATVTPTLLSVLIHELGHAFGLGDTQARQGVLRSQGGLAHTTGKQPASVMAYAVGYHNNKLNPLTLGEDDKRGVVWLYKYFHEKQDIRDCLFADYLLIELPDELGFSCRPKYPLIFEARYNPPRFAMQLLEDDQRVDVNAQDANGMTALHYAAMYEKVEVVKALVMHKDIQPSLKNKQGETPFDLAMAANYPHIADLLPAPTKKTDINKDGVVNILDLVLVAAKIGEKNVGEVDVNNDGKVNILDLVLVANAFESGASE